MRKCVLALLIFMFVSGALSMTAYAADCFKDTAADRAGDWFATLGKKGVEKNQLLAKRKAIRIRLCTQKEARKTAADIQKGGNNVKKKLKL